MRVLIAVLVLCLASVSALQSTRHRRYTRHTALQKRCQAGLGAGMILHVSKKDQEEEKEMKAKQAMWISLKNKEEATGKKLELVFALIVLRLFFTDVETRNVRICGHSYDAETTNCTPAEIALPAIGKALVGRIVLPTDPAWGGVPDFLAPLLSK